MHAHLDISARRRLAVLAAAGAVAAAAPSALLMSGSAQATTGAGGLQEPECPHCLVNVGIGTPFNGRFYLASESKEAKIVGARIDVAWSTEYGNNDYLLGEIEFRRYNSQGVPETVTAVLYPWRYFSKSHRLSAAVVPLATVTEENEDGEPIGEIALKVPPGVSLYYGTPLEAMSDHNKWPELPTLQGHMKLEGVTSPVEFIRENRNKLPGPMPLAKRIGAKMQDAKMKGAKVKK